MIGINVGASRFSTGIKKPFLVAGSYPPNIHCCGIILPTSYFLRQKTNSSISTMHSGPPNGSGLLRNYETQMKSGIFALNHLLINLGLYHHFYSKRKLSLTFATNVGGITQRSCIVLC